MRLPSIRYPFPVKIPFETSVDMYKMGSTLYGEVENTLLRFDRDFERTISEKLAIFERFPAHSLVMLEDDLAGLAETFWRVFQQLAAENLDFLNATPHAVRSYLLGITLMRAGELRFDRPSAAYPELGERAMAVLRSVDGVKRLGAMLALSIQPDHVIMHNPTGEPNADVAESLFVALPTHWDPLENLGKSLKGIHAPVGDNKRLLNSSPQLIKAMINKGPFVRHNWALANLDTLCQNPVFLEGQQALFNPNMAEADTPEALLQQLHFRAERQTLINYPDLNRGLFLIRIYQRPLIEALESRRHAEQLARAIRSMTAPQLAYRAMEEMQETLLAGLDQLAKDLP